VTTPIFEPPSEFIRLCAFKRKGETRRRHQGEVSAEETSTESNRVDGTLGGRSVLPIHLPLKPLERSVGFLCANGSRITLTVTRRQEPGDFFSLFCHLGKIALYLPKLFYG
jgi:hypothetical protein